MSKSKITLLMAGLMASLLLAALDSTVISTAMKSIAVSLGGMQYYSWPFTVYMLCSTIAIPVCGGLADIYGHKPVFWPVRACADCRRTWGSSSPSGGCREPAAA